MYSYKATHSTNSLSQPSLVIRNTSHPPSIATMVGILAGENYIHSTAPVQRFVFARSTLPVTCAVVRCTDVRTPHTLFRRLTPTCQFLFLYVTLDCIVPP